MQVSFGACLFIYMCDVREEEEEEEEEGRKKGVEDGSVAMATPILAPLLVIAHYRWGHLIRC